MKLGTFLRLLLIMLFCGACTRNPLGEDIRQPILNLSFTLTQSCTNTFNQDLPYSCQLETSDEVAEVEFQLDTLLTTCSWASLDPATGVVTGNPGDNQVGACQMVVSASNEFRTSPAYVYYINVVNVQPTLTITNPAPMFEDAAPAIIRTDADVQASEEGLGRYTLDNTNTTIPRCSDNADVLTVDANTGAVTFGPMLNYTGTCNIRVVFDDENGVSSSTVVSEFPMTVLDINDPPVLSAIGNQTTNEDVPLAVNFTITDPENGVTCASSVSAVSSNPGLIAVGDIVFSGTAPNCTATITPSLNNTGSSNITFTLTDTGVPVLTDTQSFTVSVVAVNDAPVLAAIGAQNTNEDTPLVINLNISDVDSTLNCGASMSATSSDGAIVPVGNIVFGGVAPNCTATITPVADQNGVLSLTFTVSDSGMPVETDSETFTLTVAPVNDAPVISAIGAQSTSEDTAIAVNFIISDIDSSLDCSTSLTADSTNLALVPVANVVFSGAAPNCTATISPSMDANGNSTLTLTVADSGLPVLTDSSAFILTVNAVNDPPVISAITAQATDEDTPLNVNFTVSDVDSTLDCTTSVTASTSDAALVHVAGVVFSGTAPNCIATVSPLPDQNGTVDLTFTVADAGIPVEADAETFTLTVNPVNDDPVMAAIAAQTTNEDTVTAVNFTITDVDSTLNCATSVTAMSSDAGLVPAASIIFSGVAPNCTATFTPVADQNGSVDLTFTVSDAFVPLAGTHFRTFTLTVNAVNDAPVMSAIAAQNTDEDTPLSVNFTITDVDSTLDCSTSVTAITADAVLVPVGNISFSGTAPNCVATVTPDTDQYGAVDLTFTVVDPGMPVENDSQTFTLTIDPVNDSPVIAPIAAQSVNEDGSLNVNFTITDVDSSLDCTSSVSAATTAPSLVPVAAVSYSGTAPNCTATVAPLADQNGSVDLTFTVTDTGVPVGVDAETFTLTVNPVNDSPVMAAIGPQTVEESDSVVVNFTVDDIDNILMCSALNLSATSSDAGLMPVASIVFGGTIPNCTATFTPTPGLFGTSNISFTVNDNGTPNLQDTESFVLTVTPFNDPPVISVIGPQSTNEDTQIVINFNISDVDNIVDCSTSMSATSNNAGLVPAGSVVFSGTAPNCTATFTPVADQNGFVDLSFIVTDTGSPVKNDTETFTLTVNAVNDAPILSAIGNQTTNEDTAEIINFTITDVDNTLDCTTSIVAGTNNAGLVPAGNVVFSGTAPTCTATITPVLDQNGAVDLTFTLSDTGTPVETDAETFTLTVNAVNDAPILSAIGNQTTNEDTAEIINFTITDVDNTLDCTTSIVAGTNNAGLVPAGNVVFSGTAPTCTATITPVLNQSGAVDLTFTLSDTGTPVETDAETFTLTVNAVNDVPVISAIGNESILEDGATVVNFAISDVDDVLSCATSLSATSSDTTLLPVANIVFGGTVPNCTATLTPDADEFGASNIRITVTDTGAPVESAWQDFTLTVVAVNDPPVLSDTNDQSTNEDTDNVINFTITDVDDVLTCAGSMSATSSNVALVPDGNIVFSGTAPNCTATISPVLNESGTSSITFTLTDGSAAQDIDSFTLTVNAINDPPVLSAIGNQSTNEDTVEVINFTITDVDSPLNCTGSLSAASTNTTLVPVAAVVFSGTAPNCTATITSDPDQNGSTDLTVTVSDGGAPVQTDLETFTLTVTAVNDAPVISAIADEAINEDNSAIVNFTVTDIDSTVDCTGTYLSANTSDNSIINPASIVYSGTAPNCTATIPPELNQSGAVNITIRVTDSSSDFMDSTFAVTISPVNDAPTISDVANQTINEDTNLGPLGFTIGDVDSVILCSSANVTATSSNTALIADSSLVIGGAYPNCTVTATPELNMTGVSTITLTVIDNGAPNLQAQDTFTVTVNAVNDPPTISTIADQTINEETSTGALNFTIGDVETSAGLTCNGSIAATSSNTVVIPNGNIVVSGTAPNCDVTVTPSANQFGGPVIITLTVTDTGLPLPAESAATTFNVTVTNVNDPPVISTVLDQTTDENIPVAVNFTISDIDDTLTCAGSMSAASTDTTLQPVSGIVFSGTAPNCTATITPALYQWGTSNITLTVTDGGGLTHSTTFLLTVNDVDQTPTISAIADTTKYEDNSSTPTLVSTPFNTNFTINDVDSPLTCAGSMSATSSNQALVPNGNISFSGTAPNCTVSVLSVNNESGTATITLTVTDGNTSAVEEFIVTYTAVNDRPTITGIPDGTTYFNIPIVVSFTIADIDSTLVCGLGPPPGGNLLRNSLNTGMVPVSNIVFGGSFPNCTATITPALVNATQAGTIIIRVNDYTPPVNVNSSFNLTVLANAAPVISAISDASFSVGVPTPINFTITDANDSLNCASNMSAVSSDQGVVPNGNIVFSGTAPNCTATVTATSTGTTNITYTVTDPWSSTASTGNNVTGLTAGSVAISQSLSTLTVTANASVDSQQAFTQVNETVTLTLRARDVNNASAGGGHWVVIQKDSGTSNGVLSAVTDNNDGTYTATFTGTTAGSARTFRASINGYPITSTLPAVTVSSVGPNCLSYRNVGSSLNGVYYLDMDGDVGGGAQFPAYCDMVTQGGGWTLAAVPRKGTAPFSETSGLVSPSAAGPSRNANIWSSASQFNFTQLRVTDGGTAYSSANFSQTKSISSLLSSYPLYSQNNVAVGGSAANANVTSSIGSTCFIVRGKSAAAGLWDDSADFLFMGFHGGISCATPLNYGNDWDRMNVTQQWLISGFDGLNSAEGPEESNSNVGQNFTGSDWTNLDYPTLIWLK